MKKSIASPHGETLYYLEQGSKANPPLILVHGNMSSSLHYLPIIDDLAKDYHVYALDLRGFGDSTYHTPIESLKDFADDVFFFMDVLGISKASLVGWSTGGGIVLEFAVKYPPMVEKIVLLESASVMGYPIFKKDQNMQPILTELYQSKAEMATDVMQVASAVEAMKQHNIDYMKAVWQAAIYNVKVPGEEELMRNLEESLKQRNLVDVDWALMTFNMSDTHNGVVPGENTAAMIQAPILNVWGEKDLVIPKVMFDQNVKYLPTANHIILKEGSHSPITDDPKALAQSILAFLA
jgi:2-hydroxy-6-oxonona-2,4-dienedioate hydrolase